MNISEFFKNRQDQLKNSYYEGMIDDYAEARLIMNLILTLNINLYVDIGANKGDMIRNVISTKDIDMLAFEPDPRSFQRLTETYGHNKKLEAHNIAIYNQNSKKKMYYVNDLTQSSLNYKIQKKYYKVKTKKLDNFINKFDKNKNTLIKIDTEGAEPEILEGMKKIIKKCDRLAIVFEYGYKWIKTRKEQYEIFSKLFSCFDLYRILPFGLEKLLNDAYFYLKDFNYTAVLGLKGMRLENKTFQIPYKYGHTKFIKIYNDINYIFEEPAL
jgi:FkbM family methyltransferase